MRSWATQAGVQRRFDRCGRRHGTCAQRWSDTPTHGSRLDAGRRCNLAKAPFVFATRGAAPLPSRTLRKPQPTKFVRVALVLPTEFAYARGVLRGIIAATRERNMYAGHTAPARRGEPPALPWLFRVYRGIYGHSSKYLGKWFRDWDPHGIIGQIYDDRLVKVYRDTGKPVVELFETRAESEFPRVLPDDVATGAMAAKHFLERGFRHFAFFGVPWMLWSRAREQGFRAEIERAFASGAGGGRGGGDAGHTFSSYGSTGEEPAAQSYDAAPGRRRRVPGMNG